MLDLTRLTMADIAVARRLLERAGDLEAGTRRALAREVARPLLLRLGRQEADVGAQPLEFLHSLVAAWDARQV
ncbi:MAG: hypothetical protein ACYCW6_14255 [Candidatus Xenobia bacterium]